MLNLFLHCFFIHSLFAAQAGASRVIAVEASEKMAAVATQVHFPVCNSIHLTVCSYSYLTLIYLVYQII